MPRSMDPQFQTPQGLQVDSQGLQWIFDLIRQDMFGGLGTIENPQSGLLRKGARRAIGDPALSRDPKMVTQFAADMYGPRIENPLPGVAVERLRQAEPYTGLLHPLPATDARVAEQLVSPDLLMSLRPRQLDQPMERILLLEMLGRVGRRTGYQ